MLVSVQQIQNKILLKILKIYFKVKLLIWHYYKVNFLKVCQETQSVYSKYS